METIVKDLGTAEIHEYREARKNPPDVVEPVVEVADDGASEEEKPKSRGGFQTKIDRLVKTVSAAERERDEAVARLKELEAKTSGKPKEETPAPQGEPQRDAFESDHAYFKALAKWEVKEELRIADEERGRKDAEEHHKGIVNAYNERVIETKARVEDWEKVVNAATVQIPPGVGPAILRMANGPDVVYYLATHPEICEEMMEGDNFVAIGKAWEISRELKAGEKQEEPEEEEEKPAPKSEKPTPIRPVGSGSTRTTTVPLDKMEIGAYRKAREAGRTN